MKLIRLSGQRCIKGERTDGNNYLEDAVELGAGALLVSKENRDKYESISSVPIFEVDNTVKALQKIASLYRDKLGVKTIGVTGSVGKTETKEILASILALKYRVHATPGNYNNQIGLPLTILSMDEDTEVLVAEMGANHKGEIELLAGIAKPDIGIITNIGPGHLEYFGSLKGVAAAKSEILKSLSEEKSAVLPADDDFFDYLKGKAKSGVVSFGFSEEADWCPKEIESLTSGGYSFVLGGQEMRINRYGKFHIANVAAASAAASCLDVPLSDIAEAVNGFKAIEKRGRIYNVDDIFFVNDSYNSNPLSLKSSIDAFMEMHIEGRYWFVLGDMLELGKGSIEMHKEVGKYCGKKGAYGLLTMGKYSVELSREASEQRRAPEVISHFLDMGKLSRYLSGLLNKGDAVLIKGSSNMEMWRLLDEIETLRETPRRRID